MASNQRNPHIIIYDSDCAFCTWCVVFVLKHSRRAKFQFAALQSQTAQSIFVKQGIHNQEMLRVIAGETVYTKSSATFFILRQLHPIYYMLQIGLLIPKFIRDAVYDVISRNRKRLIRKNVCPIIPEEFEEMFLL